MAKALYLQEYREDYMYIHFFRNPKALEAKKEELLQDEDFAENIEDNVEALNEGTFSYSKGLAYFAGDVGDGKYYTGWDGPEFRDMTEEEFRAQVEKHIEVFDAGKEQGAGGLCWWGKQAVKGSYYEDSRTGMEFPKDMTQPKIDASDGMYHTGELDEKTTFKYVPTFESFVLEAGNIRKIKGIQKQIQEINDEMESIQDAIDSGDMDPDEGEIQLSDLDANKIELEEELSNLNADERAKKDQIIRNLVSKLQSAVQGQYYQALKWSTMLDNLPESGKAERRILTSLTKRDEGYEKDDQEDIEKLYAKIEALKDDMSAEALALLSFIKTDYTPVIKDWSLTSNIVQAWEELCRKYNHGCAEEEASMKEYTKAQANYNKAKSTLIKLGKAANIRVN